MKEPYVEGLAPHDDPESCAEVREGSGEALTGARAGRVLSHETVKLGAPTHFRSAEGNTCWGAIACSRTAPRGRRPLACAEPPCTRTGRSTCRPMRHWCGPRGERFDGNPSMYGMGKSDWPVVPMKSWNKTVKTAADMVEGRGWAEGNMSKRTTRRTQNRRDP